MIMTVEEARRYLRKEQSSKLSDEEVMQMVNELDFIAKLAIDSYKKSLRGQRI